MNLNKVNRRTIAEAPRSVISTTIGTIVFTCVSGEADGVFLVCVVLCDCRRGQTVATSDDVAINIIHKSQTTTWRSCCLGYCITCFVVIDFLILYSLLVCTDICTVLSMTSQNCL